MKVYFLRRLLLVPITMIGVTFLGFFITRVMPGGPIERQMQEAAKASMSGGSSGGSGGGAGLTEEQLEELEREYGYDKIIPVAQAIRRALRPRMTEGGKDCARM